MARGKRTTGSTRGTARDADGGEKRRHDRRNARRRADAPDEPRPDGRWRASPLEKARRRRVREALLKEGFRWQPWQKPERDMVFGMIRPHGQMQTHVRYYKGGYVMAEHEIAHHYLEHVISPRSSAHDEIRWILERHGIRDVEVREKEIPRRHRGPMPPTRTPWKPIVMGAGTALIGAWMGRRKLKKGRD